jgi:hypothetical protein
MNAPHDTAALQVPALHRLALAALSGVQPGEAQGAEAEWLAAVAGSDAPESLLRAWLAAPPAGDRSLHALARALPLQPVELVAAALAMAVELDPMAARVVAWLQAPAGSSRPTVGLVLAAADALGLDALPSLLLDGSARSTGLLQFEVEGARPLPEQQLRMPLPLVLALHDGRSRWPGVTHPAAPATPAPSLRAQAERQARALQAGHATLAVRSGHPREARGACALIAQALGRQAAFFEQEPAPGAALWLSLCGLVPVLCAELAPGESRRLPALPGYHGPLLLAAGPEGSFERDGDTVTGWRVPLPDPQERSALWQPIVGDTALAERLGRQYRYDTAQIVQLGSAARYQAELAAAPALAMPHVVAAARSGVAAELGTLAELMPEAIADEVLIVPPPLRATLAALRMRCERREQLADGLGQSARARYRPGVRALFVGASGTGKTLAVAWLATQLGLPLYRVDVASVSSKYIGETEKNLAQLFARAEHAEVVLLFDEADALFGKRTDVKESNDRFANAQTNYLLQRIESFEGIAVLTSNSRGRFDSAFTRRLDVIAEFPTPSPVERRALWLAHLGVQALDDGVVNRLAAGCEFSGGHVRNVVLAAAAQACGRPLSEADLLAALAAEYAKLGKTVPAGLARAGP